jgi:hypothetical protein
VLQVGLLVFEGFCNCMTSSAQHAQQSGESMADSQDTSQSTEQHGDKSFRRPPSSLALQMQEIYGKKAERARHAAACSTTDFVRFQPVASCLRPAMHHGTDAHLLDCEIHDARIPPPSKHHGRTSSLCVQRSACACLAGARDEATMLTAARGLSNVCAMELRAVLLAATAAQRAARVQSALEDLRESTSTMRTVGAMLAPRLPPRSVERDLAGVMATQGSAASELAQELEAVLKPAVVGAAVRAALY